jgi:hypothetical protein
VWTLVIWTQSLQWQMVALPPSKPLGVGDLSKLSPFIVTQYQFLNPRPCVHALSFPVFNHIQRSETVTELERRKSVIQNCYNTCVKGEGVVLVIRQIDTAEPVQARFRQVTQTLVYGLLFSLCPHPWVWVTCPNLPQSRLHSINSVTPNLACMCSGYQTSTTSKDQKLL